MLARALALILISGTLAGCVSVGWKPAPAEPVTATACGLAMAADPVGYVALGVCGASLAVDLGRSIEIKLAQEIRVDKFDARGNRLGYDVIDPRSGRVDSFDNRQRRTGSGYIVSPPSYVGPSDADRLRWQQEREQERKSRP